MRKTSLSPRWEWSQVKLGDIHFTQDNVRDKSSHYSAFRSLCDSIAAFKRDGDPDISLSKTNAHVEVVPYKHKKLFSMDNRRLFCLKEVFGPEQKLWVKQYSSTQAYDTDHPNSSWGEEKIRHRGLNERVHDAKPCLQRGILCRAITS